MRWLRLPLLHFVAGGAGLFWLVHGANPFAIAGPATPIVVTAGDVSRLRVDYSRETGLEPTSADEAALVDKMIEEELLFREAVARGLDQNDRSVRNWLVEQMKALKEDPTADADGLYTRARALGLDRTDLVVRRILVQKMRLIAARTDERRPSDVELAAFYAAHRDEYRPPERMTFWHVFFASSPHRATVGPDAEAVLTRLRQGPLAPAEAVRQGDSFPGSPRVVAQSPRQLEKLFGAEFVTALERAEPGRWIGPVRSPYGLHLVWIEARESGTPPPFAAVRGQVLERWQHEQRIRRVAAFLRALERRYPLHVESAAWQQRSAS